MSCITDNRSWYCRWIPFPKVWWEIGHHWHRSSTESRAFKLDLSFETWKGACGMHAWLKVIIHQAIFGFDPSIRLVWSTWNVALKICLGHKTGRYKYLVDQNKFTCSKQWVRNMLHRLQEHNLIVQSQMMLVVCSGPRCPTIGPCVNFGLSVHFTSRIKTRRCIGLKKTDLCKSEECRFWW